MFRKIISFMLCAAIVVSMSACLGGCTQQPRTEDLTSGLPTGSGISVSALKADEKFAQSYMSFALTMLQNMGTEEENVLLSPLSIQTALAMTANGAVGTTQEQILNLLGGDLSMEQLNGYLSDYVDGLTDDREGVVHLANSIWLRDEAQRLQVRQDFLQSSVELFNAQVFRATFDVNTVKDVNSWVNEQTDGMISKLLDRLDEWAVMLLLNALSFEASWETVYENSDVSEGKFTAADGRTQKVDMLQSTEDRCLKDELAVGFIKPYAGGNFSFVAMLPNAGVSLQDYVTSLTAEKLLQTLHDASGGRVKVRLPKFTVNYSNELGSVLKQLGIVDAFNSETADFSSMATSTFGNIYISSVMHKSFIRVDQKGTQAGAVTSVEMNDECIGEVEGMLTLTLDRPFVYMIIDNETGLPIFIGTLNDATAG